MKQMRHWILMLVVLVCLGSFVWAGGSSEQATQRTKISITFVTGDTTTKEAIQDIVEAFNASQSKYQLQPNLSISTGAYLDSLKTLNVSGQMPDIFECRDVPVFVRADMLEPLDPELAKLFESPMPVYGTVYTAPIAAQPPHVILYNEKFFQEHGLNENPKTYAEFIQLCKDIKALGVAPIAAGVADIWHIGFLYGNYVIDYVLRDNPNWIADLYAGKTKFSSPEMKKAMTYLSSLFRDGYVEGGFMSTKESQVVSLLVAGKTAMYFTGTWTIGQIQEADPDFEIGFFPIPDENGVVTLHGGATTQGWALTKEAAKDPAKKEAFKEFIQFFFSPEQYTTFLQKANAFPTTAQHMEYSTSPLMEQIVELYNNTTKRLNWNEGAGENELPPSFRNWTYKKVQEMILGQISVDQMLADMDAQWAIDTRDFNPSKLVNTAL